MKKLITALSLVLVACFAVVGLSACKKKNTSNLNDKKFVGTWRITSLKNTDGADFTEELKEDNFDTVYFTLNQDGTIATNAFDLILIQKFNYWHIELHNGEPHKSLEDIKDATGKDYRVVAENVCWYSIDDRLFIGIDDIYITVDGQRYEFDGMPNTNEKNALNEVLSTSAGFIGMFNSCKMKDDKTLVGYVKDFVYGMYIDLELTKTA